MNKHRRWHAGKGDELIIRDNNLNERQWRNGPGRTTGDEKKCIKKRER